MSLSRYRPPLQQSMVSRKQYKGHFAIKIAHKFAATIADLAVEYTCTHKGQEFEATLVD